MKSIASRLASGLLACSLFTAAPTLADDREDAREAYSAGTLAFDNGDYSAALVQFKVANELIPTPHAMFWVARCLDKLERGDQAIAAYEELLAHPDSAKIGSDKLTTSRDRVAALKTQAVTGEDPSLEELEEPQEVDEPPPEPPADEQAPPPERSPKFTWKDHLFELGVITGPLFLNSSHNLVQEGFPHADYSLAWLLGARAGYYPLQFVGFEIDYAHGWAKVKETSAQPLGSGGDGAQFNTARGYVVGQYPVGRFVPFALVGGGILHGTSDRLGKDTDFVLVLGAGAKVAASKVFTPRLDLHFDMTQKKGGGFSEGIAVHPELLLGIDFTLGR